MPAQTGPGARLDLRFEAEPFAVRLALCRIVATFVGRIGETAAGALELALAEVLNNIVIHAYGCDGGSISLSIEASAGVLYCRICDIGKALPGGTPPPAGADSDPAAQPTLREGGWGWQILRRLAEDLTYERAGEENQLTFRMAVTG
ncbi:MAG TPA: ATP-binding protein [Albidovulum sp.]|uniref:ATP-binding protein n=1 Tax=Albidovulum sp. TaxID=1872424 RepID=UPI002BC6DC19|nr:ATP-binding protein [Albidovulum sp.]